MTFESLRLCEPICRSVLAEGYHTPTPIQSETIPHVLAGSDVLGCAQTGTGKTAAFALPILDRLHRNRPFGQQRSIRALILSPTRELAAQIGASFQTYGKHTKLRHVEIFGGVNQNPQTRQLNRGVDILVATPGRLLDLMQQGYVDLASVEIFVLDEADRMLDMGFIHDIRRIAKAVPSERQTLLFSATMPPTIRHLAASMLNDPVEVQLAPVSAPAERICQSVYFVTTAGKMALLQDVLLDDDIQRVLVFTRTKHGADRVTRQLSRSGIRAAAIHGNKTQANRKRTLDDFRSGRTSVLIATDIAARGIDVDGVTHVINFDLPSESETYVHRIGRTARAGARGTAIAFCAPDEHGHLRSIERLMRQSLTVATHTLATAPPPQPGRDDSGSAPRKNRRRRNGSGGRSYDNRPTHPDGRRRGAKRSSQRSRSRHPNSSAA